jgi:kelch-like protein 10
MNSGERYNPKTNTWMSIPDMYNPRSNFAIEICDDYLFVIGKIEEIIFFLIYFNLGGFNGVTTIFNVECFDDLTEEWLRKSDVFFFSVTKISFCLGMMQQI